MPGLLVADDMAIIRSTITDIVKRENLDLNPVTAACNGAEAVRLARQMQPDIVLMDIKMPGLNGLQAASTIRAEQPNVRIVVLSAHHEFAYARQALKFGALDYLLKPIRPRQLVSFLAQIQAQVQQEKKAARKSQETQQIEQDLLASVRLGQPQTSLALMAQLIENLLGDPEQSTEAIQTYFVRLMILLSQSVIDIGAPAAEVAAVSQRHMIELLAVSDATELRSWAFTCLAKLTAIAQCAGQDEDPVQQAMRFIDANQHRSDLTFKEVAKAAHLSSSHLAALFKAKVGISYIKYLTSRRMKHAKTLLRTSNLTVADVAETVGYQTVSYFYHVFQRETGLTPTAYRNR